MQRVPITGYFIAPGHGLHASAATADDRGNSDDDTDSESESDDDDEDRFTVELNDNDSSRSLITQPLRRRQVSFKEYDNSDKVHLVEGMFPMTNPWWSCTLCLGGGGRVKRLLGFPSYSLRRDCAVGPERVVLLFMTECHVDQQHSKLFYDALRSWQMQDSLTFENFYDLLDRFATTNDAMKSVAGQIRIRCQYGAGVFVWRALELEQFFLLIPRLLPKHFEAFVRSLDKKKLLTLQEELTNRPWVFGFSATMREYHGIKCCEAQLSNYYGSSVINRVGEVERDALHLYHVLKFFCRDEGHTYIMRPRLELEANNAYQHFLSGGAGCSPRGKGSSSPRRKPVVNFQQYKRTSVDWGRAIEFLKEVNVIVVETAGTCPLERVYLRSLWEAERNIASTFQSLQRRQKVSPWTFTIDPDNEMFAKVRGDPDQLSAAQLIGREALVVISGKGGCGKTEVVGQVFAYACQLLEDERMMNSTDIDDNLLSQLDFNTNGLPVFPVDLPVFPVDQQQCKEEPMAATNNTQCLQQQQPSSIDQYAEDIASLMALYCGPDGADLNSEIEPGSIITLPAPQGVNNVPPVSPCANVKEESFLTDDGDAQDAFCTASNVSTNVTNNNNNVNNVTGAEPNVTPVRSVTTDDWSEVCDTKNISQSLLSTRCLSVECNVSNSRQTCSKVSSSDELFWSDDDSQELKDFDLSTVSTTSKVMTSKLTSLPTTLAQTADNNHVCDDQQFWTDDDDDDSREFRQMEFPAVTTTNSCKQDTKVDCLPSENCAVADKIVENDENFWTDDDSREFNDVDISAIASGYISSTSPFCMPRKVVNDSCWPDNGDSLGFNGVDFAAISSKCKLSEPKVSSTVQYTRVDDIGWSDDSCSLGFNNVDFTKLSTVNKLAESNVTSAAQSTVNNVKGGNSEIVWSEDSNSLGFNNIDFETFSTDIKPVGAKNGKLAKDGKKSVVWSADGETQDLTNIDMSNFISEDESLEASDSLSISSYDSQDLRALDGITSALSGTAANQQLAGSVASKMPTGSVAGKMPTGSEAGNMPTGSEACKILTGFVASKMPTGSVANNVVKAEVISGDNEATDGPHESLHFSSDVLLVAPTGKAAQLLGRRTHRQAFTLHQVIFSYHAWLEQRRHNNGHVMSRDWQFASVRALVVDESSLVAVTTFNSLLIALRNGNADIRKIVLLGDVLQLPSIEPGRFLADAYEAFSSVGCSVTLHTNHRAESQGIIDNARRISQQQFPVFDATKNFHIIALPNRKQEASLSNARDQAISDLLKHKINGCNVDNDKTSQFIAFRRADCEAVNELCCKHYVKHSIKDKRTRYNFQVGDKVCCTRNAQVDDCTTIVNHVEMSKKLKQVPKIRLCNGEIFFITNMVEMIDERSKKRIKRTYVTLFDQEREVIAELKQLSNRCKLRHAWARTIHTFQGSEARTIIYVVGCGRNQTWQHVYTAVTRGRTQVIIITRRAMLQWAIETQPLRRATSLKERLLDSSSDPEYDTNSEEMSQNSMSTQEQQQESDSIVDSKVQEQDITADTDKTADIDKTQDKTADVDKTQDITADVDTHAVNEVQTVSCDIDKTHDVTCDVDKPHDTSTDFDQTQPFDISDSDFSQWTDSLQEETLNCCDRLSSQVTTTVSPGIFLPGTFSPGTCPLPVPGSAALRCYQQAPSSPSVSMHSSPSSTKQFPTTPKRPENARTQLTTDAASPSATKRPQTNVCDNETPVKRATIVETCVTPGSEVSPLRKSLSAKLTVSDANN